MRYNIDMHFDLGGIVLNRRRDGQTRVLESFYDSFKKGEFKLIVAAIFIETIMADVSLREALLQIQALKDDIKESDHFKLVSKSEDLKDDKIGILLSLEGAEPILREKSLLKIFYDLDVRGLGLVWSRRNFVADGSYFRSPEEGILGGLTPFGIEVVREAERIGYFIDVSHLNDTGFEDVLKYTDNAFIASHSNTRMVNEMPRNLSDDQIKAIGLRGGIIGINAYTSVVQLNQEKQSVQTLCDHIEHIINVAGDHVPCIGFDLCTPYYDNGKMLDVIDGHHDLHKIELELKKRDFSQETINKVFGKNAYNYLSKVL
ncbi:membrane dipeptidase [Acidaminobacter sp. JC074]|uniref:dipeptidase n=1 Tax=Acidaminobacter sp. JC074 TaxID=2530199 RepID=UPI001F0E177A|nr:membrane dipeptidase [Acidaminobacter sp. JC074]MCH4887456.1 membrane dipeptidase [Acidaminobacter sp. JC074]